MVNEKNVTTDYDPVICMTYNMYRKLYAGHLSLNLHHFSQVL